MKPAIFFLFFILIPVAHALDCNKVTEHKDLCNEVMNSDLSNNDGRKRIEIKRPLSSMFAASDYSMELYLNKEKFKERIDEIAGKGVLPVLVWFWNEEA